MKKIAALALPLVLAACGQQGVNIGQGFQMTPSFDGTTVAANVVNVYAKNADGTRGAYQFSEVRSYVVTQGKLNVVVRAGSLGMTVKQANVKYTEASGNPFGGEYSTFNVSSAFEIPEGFVCPDGTDICDFTQKKAQNVLFSKTEDLYQLSEQIAIAAADTCVSGSTIVGTSATCGEIRMNITLSGTDKLGAPRTINIPQAQVRVYVSTVTDEVR